MDRTRPSRPPRNARPARTLTLLFMAGALACGEDLGPQESTGDLPAGVLVPLTEMGSQTYLGFEGGLYPDGNEPPAEHATAGQAAARAVRPLDGAGVPAGDGRIVVLSVGMSNTTQEFCSGPPAACASYSFVGQALADPELNPAVVLADGAAGGQAAPYWDDPADPNYARVKSKVLPGLGVTPAQVQVAWVKVANPRPEVSLPNSAADAYTLVSQTGDIVRALRLHFPNLRQVFLSSRIYAGYATTQLNPEPFAFESGFAVKWVVQAQIDQVRTGRADARAGDLDYRAGAPWIAWGPYLWANGTTPRADGLVWERGDLGSDGTHPSQAGRQKVGKLLLDVFRTSTFTSCWFLKGRSCG